MDYKLPEAEWAPDAYRKFCLLGADDTVKFVVKDYTDLCRARDVIREYDLTEKCHVYLTAGIWTD